MSYGGGHHGRTERVRQSPLYDQVPHESLPPAESYDLQPLKEQRSPRLAKSADPLPPPPLPDQPPVGPEFDPSDGEEDTDPEPDPAIDIKPVHRFIPDSWKNFFRGSIRSSKKAWSMPESSSNNNNCTTEGVRCSPPQSPSLPRSYRDPYGGSGSSYNSGKELLNGQDAHGSVSGHTQHTALTYSERVEEYHQRYGYMKSWAGLLRILGCVELLLGAAVFACVCAYIHKDNEWYNIFSHGNTSTMFSFPAIVYVTDTNRGGLCFNPAFNNPINGAFCRVEAGQTAAIIFLFLTMVVYLIGAIVCLKLWRHEAARRYQEQHGQQVRAQLDERMVPSEMHVVQSLVSMLLETNTFIWTAVPDSAPAPRFPEQVQGSSVVPIQAAPKPFPPKVIQGAIPSGHIPKPVVVPDYLAKYPAIRSDEERDQYRAVFNDQYAEYKELHTDVQATLKRFDEMDAMMRSLPQNPSTQMEVERINKILQEYQKKKNDPTFLEKKERCEYLKLKLSHIKQRIQEYNKVMGWNDGYS
ncbi:hypothetical protein CCH79_00001235, partial [Gambusia affinis]